jgi:hypothetical protein
MGGEILLLFHVWLDDLILPQQVSNPLMLCPITTPTPTVQPHQPSEHSNHIIREEIQ